MNILIVDDSSLQQASLKFLMKEWGYQFDTANNGQEAVEKTRSNHYDICLMDINMPVMDGCEATKAIRQDSNELPILAVTGLSSNDQVEEYLKIGINACISKPYNSKALHEKIVNLVGALRVNNIPN